MPRYDFNNFNTYFQNIFSEEYLWMAAFELSLHHRLRIIPVCIVLKKRKRSTLMKEILLKYLSSLLEREISSRFLTHFLNLVSNNFFCLEI